MCLPPPQVNLLPSDEPQDVYAGVRSLVERKVHDDAADADEPNQPLAMKLVGLITRKVVKQTVMTSVYGVTFIGAKRQVENRCVRRAAHRGLLTTYYSLLTTHYALRTTHY